MLKIYIDTCLSTCVEGGRIDGKDGGGKGVGCFSSEGRMTSSLGSTLQNG